MSYCDPNLLKTVDVYDGTGDFLRQLEMDDDTLTKAIIGTIRDVRTWTKAIIATTGHVASYQLPNSNGYSRYIDITYCSVGEWTYIRASIETQTRN